MKQYLCNQGYNQKQCTCDYNCVITILPNFAVCCRLSLTVVALLQVVQSGGKNIELAVIRRNQPLKVIICIVLNTFKYPCFKTSCFRTDTNFPGCLQILESKEIETLVAEIEKEKEEEAEKKKQKKST